MAQRPWPERPFLLLDLDAFDRNVAQMARTVTVQGGKRWRPHAKSIRSPALMKRLLDAGASGVTCANVQEAEVMVASGIGDVLISSQVVGREQALRLARLNRNARVISAVDASAHGALLAAAAAEAGVTVPVVIEVDIGLRRAGVTSVAAAVALARELSDRRGLHVCGVMAWEGQTTRIPEPAARRAAIQDAVGLLTATAHACRLAGVPMDIVSCGGTGTYPVTSTLEGVTEIQAGGGVFGDVRCRTDFGLPHSAALTLRATVISRPAPGRLVCDAGWKYHGCQPTLSRPLGMPVPVRQTYAAEHLTLDCEQKIPGFAIGSPIDLEVGYADSTVFLHREIWAVRDGVIEDVVALPAH